MAVISDYLFCVAALVILCWETWLIIKRNRTIILKGKDDFLTFCLILLFVMLFLRSNMDESFLVSLRNTLVLTAIFFSIAVKRGISEQGIVKLGFLIQWDQIRKIQIEPYQLNRLILRIITEKHQFQLFYPKYQLKKLIYELQKYYPQVMIAEELKVE